MGQNVDVGLLEEPFYVILSPAPKQAESRPEFKSSNSKQMPSRYSAEPRMLSMLL